MKANSKSYKGIEYVVISDLPSDQQSLLEQKNNIERIKILMDGKIVGNCIAYQAYSDWFHAVFKQRIPVARSTQKDLPATINVAFNKG